MGRAFEYRRASKEARWDKMSKLFPKLAKSITFAAKQGGLDPDMNPRLRTAIMNAKAQNMPKDNIDAAIKRAAGKDEEQLTEIVYEGKGPHGSLFMVECTTNNTNRSVANIKTHFNKLGGQLVTSGQMEYLFCRKAVIEIEPSDKINTEELELDLIDAGLDEIEVTDDMIYIYGDYTTFGNLVKALEDKGIEPKKASLQRVATQPISLTEEQMNDVEKLIDKLEDDEDVQAVYTNVE